MNIRAMVATMAIALVGTVSTAGTASAGNIAIPTGQVISVCVEATANSSSTIFQARAIASKMFAAASLTIEWRRSDNCPADGIRISLSQFSRASDHPKAYAYALPYEGTHIVLFWDRIQNSTEPRGLPYLVAHVLVHEITHILEGTCRHSDTGVMKAVFTRSDIDEMGFHPLAFAAVDLDLIRDGLNARAEILAQAKLNGDTANSSEAAVTR
jgi:hypothetical protein